MNGLSFGGKVVTGPKDVVSIAIADPNGSTIKSVYPFQEHNFVAVARPGWYQVLFSRKGGTRAKVLVDAAVDDVQLHILNEAVEIGNATLLVENLGSELDVEFMLKPEAKIVDEAHIISTLTDLAIHDFQLREAGDFVFEARSVSGSTISDWSFYCLAILYDAEGAFISRTWVPKEGRQLRISKLAVGGKLSAQCGGFEMNDNYFTSLDTIVWQKQLFEPPSSQAPVANASKLLSAYQTNEVFLEWSQEVYPEQGDHGLYVRHSRGDKTEIKVGTLTLVDFAF